MKVIFTMSTVLLLIHPKSMTCSLSYCAGSRVGDVAEALAITCIANTKLRRVKMWDMPFLPVMKALTTRQVPLEKLEMTWVC